MINEHTLLALLDSKEAEASAKDEWITEWVDANHLPLLSGQLDTDVGTLQAEANPDQKTRFKQAVYLLMVTGDKVPLTLHIQQLLEQGLTVMADDAWSDHVAALEDAMGAEQWEQYQQRNAA